MIKKIIFSFCLILFFIPCLASAGCCGCDPVYDRDWHGQFNLSAYVRDIACMEGSKVLATGQQGMVVPIIAETDGWYKVKLADGTLGWVGARLMTVTDKPLSEAEPAVCTQTCNSGLEKHLGMIFLAVEQNGEAYYYYPTDEKAYYLGRPDDAFKIMRELGLGATHEFISSHTYFPENVKGKILLDVEQNGEAYYIYPKDMKKYYLGRPTDSFVIMRSLGIGISNNDLNNLEIIN